MRVPVNAIGVALLVLWFAGFLFWGLRGLGLKQRDDWYIPVVLAVLTTTMVGAGGWFARWVTLRFLAPPFCRQVLIERIAPCNWIALTSQLVAGLLMVALIADLGRDRLS